MSNVFISSISADTGLNLRSVSAVVSLIEAGATVPFIARYRKEATGNLDEVSIISIRDQLEKYRRLDERRNVILRSLAERGLLTDQLKNDIGCAKSLTDLEDVYLPFRPKRKTRASRAREKGLEPLARRILLQAGDDPLTYSAEYVDADAGAATVREAIDGACDIIAEILTQDPDVRASMRDIFWSKGVYVSRCVSGMEEKGAKYRDYFQWEELVRKAPSHRVLAMRRGEDEGFLRLGIAVPEEKATELIRDRYSKGGGSQETGLVEDAARDGYRRLLAPAMETWARTRSKQSADREAIRVFAKNLRNLLLAPPLGTEPVMAVDPGFRTGCKTVCLSREGTLLHHETIHPFRSDAEADSASNLVKRLQSRYGFKYLAVGNGTAGRETERFLSSLGLPDDVRVVMVSESGASVYSASKVARQEFPDLDVTFRGAVSIGRRLQDPLAELVKLDPRSIGVGQYQHDVDAGLLQKALDDTVESCVNSVGVDLNTASIQLLAYVSGLDGSVAERIVRRRIRDGAFADRRQLLSIRGLGPVRYQQCAGFLRIKGGDNLLDSTAVHPESYGIVERMAETMGVEVRNLIGSPNLRQSIDISDFADGETGIHTLRDIMDELERPGRDPRDSFRPVQFADVHSPADLRAGMILPGVVTNVTNFGAFVDVGVHQDGLVHVSQMSDEYVRDPNQVVSAGDFVTVRVISLDEERGRISLSMKSQRD